MFIYNYIQISIKYLKIQFFWIFFQNRGISHLKQNRFQIFASILFFFINQFLSII